ncbi:hypothetical protein ACP275_12G069000 [Erythranthe tilingii]
MVEESLRVLQLDPPFSPGPMNSCCFDSPCLMYSQSSNNSWKFYNSLRNEFSYLDLPELKDAEILYSNCGWLLMSQINNGPLFFFNPLTRQKFQLPPTKEPFDSVCFTSPPTCSDCFVFGIFGSSNLYEIEYGIIRFGDEEWKIEWDDCESREFLYANCPPVFHNGMYYCLDVEWRCFRVYDPTNDEWTICGHCPQTIEDSYDDEKKDGDEDGDEDGEEDGDEEEDEEEEKEVTQECYDEKKEENKDEDGDEDEDEEEEKEVTQECYVVQVDGEIWGVFVMNNDRKVEVLKFDLSEKCWNKVESLGDKCLYVSPNGSFAEDCGDGSDKANKIYFNKFHGKNGVWYSLSSGMYHSAGGNFASKDAYGLTQVDYSTWIKST